jgi:hypothetical protein
MELRLPPVHAYLLNPTLTREAAQQQAIDKRLSIVAGGLSGLFSRPKPEEVDLTYSEFRWEAFWHMTATVRYVFERNKTYAVPVTGSEVRKVTAFGQEFEVVAAQPPAQQSSPAGFLQQIGQQIGLANTARSFSLPGIEHCVDENRQERFLEAASGQAVAAGADYVKKDKTELADLAMLSANDAFAVAPQMKAAQLLRSLLATMVKQIQSDKILEEATTVDTFDLYFRPVYAFELTWRSKSKIAVAEFDGVTGNLINGKVVRSGGTFVPAELFDVDASNAASLFPSTLTEVKLMS